MKKYRVSSEELFNLDSMREKLLVDRDKLRESNLRGNEWAKMFNALEEQIAEVERLLDICHRGVGSLIPWSDLAKIREIAAFREAMRDRECLRSLIEK